MMAGPLAFCTLLSGARVMAATVPCGTWGEVAMAGCRRGEPSPSAMPRMKGNTDSRSAVIGLSLGWLKASTAMHKTEPNMRVAYASITTETCMTSQSDWRAGTREEAFCSSLGSFRVAKATMPSERGEAMTAAMSLIAVFFAPNLLFSFSPYAEDKKKIVTAVTPQAKNIKDSYMLLKGKWPLSYQRPDNSTAMEMQEKRRAQKEAGLPSSPAALAPPRVARHQAITVLASKPPKAPRSKMPWNVDMSMVPTVP
mmetsp:Transcript_857/g.2268  ORF Transcript_857/g.2268 Transcript_857/m.2268 type:complete len:254 (-) Transcript_857:303-1064(-)